MHVPVRARVAQEALALVMSQALPDGGCEISYARNRFAPFATAVLDFVGQFPNRAQKVPSGE